MTDRERIKKLLSFYGPGGAVDTPVKIGYDSSFIRYRSEIEESKGRHHAFFGKQPATAYYKVVRVENRHHCGDDHLHHMYGDIVRVTEYVYFYLYFPIDTNHKHDWTGGMLEVVDGVPKRLVCRSHWDMVVTGAGFGYPLVRVSNGDHSLSGDWTNQAGYNLYAEQYFGVKKLNPTFIELTAGHGFDIAEIAKTASITHHETWGDAKAMTWCRSLLHRRDYKKLCIKHGAVNDKKWWQFWLRRFPKPSELFDKYPKLFMGIMERIGR